MKRMILGAALLLLTAFTATAETHLLTGKVTDNNGALVTGSHDVVVRFYDVATGGAALWTETHVSVTFTDGWFTITVGSQTSGGFPAAYLDGSHFLSVTVADIGRGELEPRTEAARDETTWTGFW